MSSRTMLRIMALVLVGYLFTPLKVLAMPAIFIAPALWVLSMGDDD